MSSEIRKRLSSPDAASVVVDDNEDAANVLGKMLSIRRIEPTMAFLHRE